MAERRRLYIGCHQKSEASGIFLRAEVDLWHPTHWQRMLSIGHLSPIYIASVVSSKTNYMSTMAS